MISIQEEAKLRLVKLSSIMKRNSSVKRVQSNIPSSQSKWGMSLIGLILFGVVIALNGLFYFQNNITSQLAQPQNKIFWFVLVKGDQLEIDEVGRLLTQVKGVSDVVFVPSEDAYEQMKSPLAISEDNKIISPQDFPAYWKIEWADNQAALFNTDDNLAEIKTYKGVVDVAFDEKTISYVNILRTFRSQIKLTFSILYLIGALFLALMVGRILFTQAWKQILLSQFFSVLIQDFIWWSAGFLIGSKLIGFSHWGLLASGLLFSAIHAGWGSAVKKS